MSEKVHPEETVAVDESDEKPLKQATSGWGPRVVIVSHGDVEAGANPKVRIRTGHSANPHKEYEVCRNALFCIPYHWKLRKAALAIIEWKWFDRFILFNIMVISLLTASFQWRQPADQGVNLVITTIEHVINAFFTLEFLLKVTARGFVLHKGAYLRNPWNLLDFLVVLDANLAYFPFLPSGGLNFLRLFRALRPLRSLNAIPQMKVLVNTLIGAVPRLGNVTLMGAFLFGIFAIIGMTLYDGVFYHRCRTTETPQLDPVARCWKWEYDANVDRLCGGSFSCPTGSWCGGHEEDPDESLRPRFPGGRQGLPWCSGSEPTKLFPETDFIHFDHFGGAILIVFQCMTLEGWTDIMYMVQDGWHDIAATVYFCMMICVTSHFLLNVALAVVDEVRDSFDEEEELDSGDEAEPTGGGEDECDPEKPLWMDCCPVRVLNVIATSEIFLNIIMMAIIGNVITMCLDKYQQETSWKDFIEVAEITFLVIFCVEMVIMLGAMGPIKYVKNPVTAFDGLIVITSVIQQALGQSGPLTALRTLRLFRVLNKLQDRWHSLRVLLKAMLHTGMALNYWLVLFVLVLYICTLMAQSFFNRKFHFNDPDAFDVAIDGDKAWCTDWTPPGQQDPAYWQDCIPRAHFDTFLWAFVTIFQIMTGENWNTVMYAGMRATHWVFTLFFWFLIIFGQILFVSLFLSILTSKFQLVNKQIEKEQARKRAAEARRRAVVTQSLGANIFLALRKTGRSLSKNLSRHSFHATADATADEDKAPRKISKNSSNNEDSATKRVDVRPKITGVSDVLPGQVNATTENTQDETKGLPLSVPECETGEDPGEIRNSHLSVKSELPGTPDEEKSKKCGAAKGQRAQRTGWPYGYAWFILSEKNPIRRAARWILNKNGKVFDNFILVCILLSTVCMMIDFPRRDPNDTLTKVIREADRVFAIIFMCEMAIKLVALGLVWGPDAYLKSGWNWLDGLVVIVSIIGMASDGAGGFLKTLRILRALRPLRVISRNDNLKVVVQTIFSSVPDLATLLVVSSLFLLIFALICLSYLKGTFYHCPMPDDPDPKPALLRDIGGLRTPLCVADTLPTSSSQLGYANDAMAKQDGSWNSTANVWEIGTCAAGSHAWRRATVDTPICIGRCDPMESTEHKPASWLCPKRFTTVEELPPVGACANRPPTAAEQRGIAFTQSMQRALVMPCGGSAVVNGTLDYSAGSAASCRALFCPAGTISSDRQASCRSTCRKQTDFCTAACQKQDLRGQTDAGLSLDCRSCLHECQAQCECEEFCEPLIKDAALCHEQGQSWSPALSQSFDNIWTSLLTLFEISTTEGWVDVMYSAADSTDVYVQPKRDNYQWYWAPFFVFYIFFMTMFLINLSVGIIVERFIELKNTDSSRPLMTPAQERWVRSKMHLYKKKGHFPMTNLHLLPRMRRSIYRLVTHKYFDRGIMAAIMCNTLLMSLKVFPSPATWYMPLLSGLNYFFFGVFFLEACLKIFALRLQYFRDNWNIFDFVCVLSGVVSLLVRILSTVDIVAVSGVVRIFRIARLFRIMRSFKEVNKIFMALVLSLPKLANVMAILLLVLTLYGILGVSLFSTAKKPADGTLNLQGNFDNFWKAFITLFRASTGEAWNELMHDLAKDERMYYREGEWCSPADLFDPQTSFDVLQSKCLIEDPNACVLPIFGSNVLPVIYWVSYIVVCLHLMMNLVIAVILDGYEEGRHTPPEEVEVELCMERWKKYDPDITEKLPLPKAMAFINECVVEILRRESADAEDKAGPLLDRSVSADMDVGGMPMHFAKCFDLQVLPDGKVSFASATRQVLRIAVVAGKEENIDEIEHSDKMLDERTARKLKHMEQKKKDDGRGDDLRLVIAATKLQRRWRLHHGRKMRREMTRERLASRGAVQLEPSGVEKALAAEEVGARAQADDSQADGPKDSARDANLPPHASVGTTPDIMPAEKELSPPKAGTPDTAPSPPPRAG